MSSLSKGRHHRGSGRGRPPPGHREILQFQVGTLHSSTIHELENWYLPQLKIEGGPIKSVSAQNRCITMHLIDQNFSRLSILICNPIMYEAEILFLQGGELVTSPFASALLEL